MKTWMNDCTFTSHILMVSIHNSTEDEIIKDHRTNETKIVHLLKIMISFPA